MRIEHESKKLRYSKSWPKHARVIQQEALAVILILQTQELDFVWQENVLDLSILSMP
jgi:hypothetical protein